MKTLHQSIKLFAALAMATAFAQSSHGATNVWNGASGSDVFWSTAGNWTPAGPPGSADVVRFFDTGAAASPSTINNTVSANRTIGSLTYGQTNGYHNTLISPGVTLTISNSANTNLLLVGTEAVTGVSQQETNSISGTGAKLVITSTNAISTINIREAHTTSGTHRATLDMSGLDTFSATLGKVQVAVQGPVSRPAGTWLLAKTNSIRATGGAPAICVGDGTSNGGAGIMDLGVTNAIYADTITVARQKASSRLDFNPAFTNATVPVAYLRGVVSNRVSNISIADNSAQSTSGSSTTGTIDLTGGFLDAAVDTIYVARSQNGTGTGTSTGTLTIGNGTLDVNTVEVAYQQASGSAQITGTLGVNGNGTIRVNNSLRMGRYLGGDKVPSAKLNINGGTVQVNGSFVSAGTIAVNVTNGTLSLPAGAQVIANTVTVDGGTITNATVLAATNSLLLANGGRITGNPVLDMGTSGSALWDVSAIPTGLVFNNTLQGSGSVLGDVTQGAGATISPGGNGIAGTMTLYNNLTLNGGKMPLDLSSSAFSGNDQITVSANLTLAGTNAVTLKSLSGSFDTTSPYTIIGYSGAFVGNASYFQVVGPLTQSRYSFAFDTTTTPGAVLLHVSGAGSANLTWTGDGSANLWNYNSAPNWNNGSGPDKFFNLDTVTFDDAGSASPAVNLVGSLIPGSISMNNFSKNYTFAGTGSLAGGSLSQNGSGSLTIANSSDNTFTGPVTVNSGSVTFSNSGLNTFASGVALNGGQIMFTGTSSNDFSVGGLTVNYGTTATLANSGQNTFGSTLPVEGTLAFSQPVNTTLGAVLSGNGTVIKSGAGVLSVTANNSGLVNPVFINGGILQVTTANALPTTGAILTNGNGTLDVGNVNLGSRPVLVSGAGAGGLGAIVNNNGNLAYVNPNLNAVTMTGDTTFGGTGRWDLRSPGGSTGDPSTAYLSTGGQPYNLTKLNTGGVYIVSATVDPALADIHVFRGTLSFEGNTTTMGDTSKTLTIEAGGTLQLYRTTNFWNKKFVFYGDGTNLVVNNASWTNTMIGPVTLNGVCPFNCGGNYLTNSGPVSGSGGILKVGSATLVLTGPCSYAGATTVSNGVLEVNNSLAGSGVAVDGGTLAGVGPIGAPVSVNTAGILSPAGDGIGTMTISGALTLGGTSRFDVSKSGGSFANDIIQGSSSLTYGGTLQLVLTGDALAAGDSIKLFNATAYAGVFTSITPATPGAGLVWDTSSLSSGTLRVATPPPVITSVTLSGNSVVIAGTGGLPGTGYSVVASANIALPMASWSVIASGTYGAAGEFSISIPVDPALPERFLRIKQ